mmetsp:Transcript_17530/g.34985  ORF Transcript_17530/g.34985 Transcript_17530/m.34985 type:complete len:444 (+) Transcript_17530:66-1397(+)
MAKTTITKLLLIACSAAALCSSWQVVEAFSITSSKCQRRGLPKTLSSLSPSPFRLYQGLSNDNNEVDNQSSTSRTVDASSSSCWNPNLRNTIAAISSLGILETAYLTYDKLQYTSSGGNSASLVTALCSSSQQGSIGGSCNDVLHGPYASLHIGSLDIPLSVLGMMAYTMVFSLAIFPVLFNESNDNSSSSSAGGDAVVVVNGQNRIALLGVTTLMASFSVYLVSLIIGVLHASCLFCFLSAGLSVSMAGLSWFGGMLPGSSLNEELYKGMDGNVLSDISELRKNGMSVGASSVGLATVMALGIFLTVDDSTSTMPSAASSGTLLASTSKTARFEENAPPAITTTSSKAALALAADLNSLDARMFGAFWCSHCYDQKQALGYEAMQTIPYIECDREGFNSKRDFCKEKDVPGYPTWEIGGKLFPGERSVDELREMVDEVMSSK